MAAGSSAASAQTLGSSPTAPAPVGLTVSGIIECGQGYTSHELYDMRITVIESVRGMDAWRRIQAASSTNKPAGPGSEYILAKVRFEYFARGNPGTCIHPLNPEQFAAYSANGTDYKAAGVVLPKPELRKDLKSGESVEGWLAFTVAQQDKSPLMYYSADQGGGTQHGGGKWFVLH